MTGDVANRLQQEFPAHALSRRFCPELFARMGYSSFLRQRSPEFSFLGTEPLRASPSARPAGQSPMAAGPESGALR
jgi:hypothetical protein